MRNNLPGALLAGLIAFIVTFVIIAILEAVLNAVRLGEVASVLDNLQFWISLLVGVVVGYNRYNGKTTLR